MSDSPVLKPSKICSSCGIDVSSLKRYKDSENNYFCVDCWAVGPESQTTVPVQDSVQDELLYCEVCEGRFLPKHLQLEAGKVICKDCLREQKVQAKHQRKMAAGTSSSIRSGNMHGVSPQIHEIALAQRKLMWAILLSLLSAAVFPLLIITLPLQIFRAAKLANALGSNGVLWGILACVPYASVLTLLILNSRATSELRSAGIPVGLMGAKV